MTLPGHRLVSWNVPLRVPSSFFSTLLSAPTEIRGREECEAGKFPVGHQDMCFHQRLQLQGASHTASVTVGVGTRRAAPPDPILVIAPLSALPKRPSVFCAICFLLDPDGCSSKSPGWGLRSPDR